MSTSWAEKKQEVCYTGSYFDQKGGQCKWVGVGNFNCDQILGKDENKDKEKEEDKKESESTDSAKTDEENGDSSGSSGKDNVRNRQKIFYDVNASKQESDSIIPPNLYTCSAELTVEYETNSDYIKCYACDADAKSLSKCKNTPNTDSNVVVWCNSKAQKCYSKAVYNTTNKNNEEIISYSRGCASLTDLQSSGDQSDSSSKTTTKEPSNANKTPNNLTCIQRTNVTKTCFVVCDSHLCNTVTDIKASSSSLTGSSKLLIILILVLICSFIYL
jgi:hypothetical protein